MLTVFACLLGIFGLLVIAELLGKYNILKGEYHRKFLHVSAGAFIAFWPWLISWESIRIIALAMIIVMFLNRLYSIFNYHGLVGRATHGDIFFAIAIYLAAVFTDSKIIFAVAILEVAVADGLAAVAGIAYGKRWTYKVFGNTKTVIGSMVFWLASVCILGVGLLAANDWLNYQDYYLLILLLPPLLTLVENLSVYGTDNLALPLLTIAVLTAVQTY